MNKYLKKKGNPDGSAEPVVMSMKEIPPLRNVRYVLRLKHISNLRKGTIN
jgi:hypothetical protein